jgi:radical SAM protein with 4Fe4S-binding SPASM domain
MTLEYSAPLRVTWDVPVERNVALALWERLRQGRVLFVEAFVDAEAAESFAAVAGAAAGAGGPRIELYADAVTQDRISAMVAGEALAKVERVCLHPYPAKRDADFPAYGLWSTPEGLADFAEAARRAALHPGGGKVVVLNPPVPADPLTPRDRETARLALEEAKRFGRVEVRAHDLFLSEVLGLEPFTRYPGCAAARTLAHLTRQGELVACRTLPLHLGNLLEEDLRDVWKGRWREAVLERSAPLPPDCYPCAIAGVCKGGCPGLAQGGGRDRSCTGIRAASTAG